MAMMLQEHVRLFILSLLPPHRPVWNHGSTFGPCPADAFGPIGFLKTTGAWLANTDFKAPMGTELLGSGLELRSLGHFSPPP
jgi:hypothetical protein